MNYPLRHQKDRKRINDVNYSWNLGSYHPAVSDMDETKRLKELELEGRPARGRQSTKRQ
jgi:hypothetical protein